MFYHFSELMTIKHSLVLPIALIVDLNYWLTVNIISRFSRVVAKDDGIYGLVKKPLLAWNVCRALWDTLSAVNRVQWSSLGIQTLTVSVCSLVSLLYFGIGSDFGHSKMIRPVPDRHLYSRHSQFLVSLRRAMTNVTYVGKGWLGNMQ